MLNRRTLRIKAMQAIYAYSQAEGSNYLMALDRLEETFAPDLNSMEPQDHRQLEGKRKLSSVMFREWYHKRELQDEGQPKEVASAVKDAVLYYQNQTKKDRTYFGQHMLAGVEKIYDNYLRLLLLLEEYHQLAQRELEELQNRHIRSHQAEALLGNFLRNKVLQRLRENQNYQDLIVRRQINWNADRELVRQVYKNVLRPDEEFLAYLNQADPTFEDDRKILKHIVKRTVFKDETLRAIFEEADLNWVENELIVKSLFQKTLKLFEEQANPNLRLLDLSTNWEDDRAFFEDLYHHTLQEWDQNEQLIAGSVKNWDIERVALIDKIILKMALSEMTHFHSIPVKVTINEYIEISKLYSTPKSKQFVNGVLDKLSQELIAKGLIRKSGRGLIDNQ